MTDNRMEVTLPKNKYTMEFVGLHLKDREKVIQLGITFLQDGKRILQDKNRCGYRQVFQKYVQTNI